MTAKLSFKTVPFHLKTNKTLRLVRYLTVIRNNQPSVNWFTFLRSRLRERKKRQGMGTMASGKVAGV